MCFSFRDGVGEILLHQFERELGHVAVVAAGAAPSTIRPAGAEALAKSKFDDRWPVIKL